MGISDYFKPAPSWSTEEVRTFLNEKEPEKYNLVDVRQPKEYEQGHLPGAQLIPLGELANRVKELDPNKPTIAY
jgi:rhodanese-related sulfurtransferase